MVKSVEGQPGVGGGGEEKGVCWLRAKGRMSECLEQAG